MTLLAFFKSGNKICRSRSGWAGASTRSFRLLVYLRRRQYNIALTCSLLLKRPLITQPLRCIVDSPWASSGNTTIVAQPQPSTWLLSASSRNSGPFMEVGKVKLETDPLLLYACRSYTDGRSPEPEVPAISSTLAIALLVRFLGRSPTSSYVKSYHIEY